MWERENLKSLQRNFTHYKSHDQHKTGKSISDSPYVKYIKCVRSFQGGDIKK